jgi:hypothetical protein
MQLANGALILSVFLLVYLIVSVYTAYTRRGQATGHVRYRNPDGDATSPRYTLTKGSDGSRANLPFAVSVPSSGYDPLKHASQCSEREPPIASYTPSSER